MTCVRRYSGELVQQVTATGDTAECTTELDNFLLSKVMSHWLSMYIKCFH